MLTVCARAAARGDLLLLAPAGERIDGLTQRDASIGERVRARVVPQGQSGQHPGRLELSQPGGEHVRRHPELTLQISVPLRPVEKSFDDEQRPSGPDDVEGCGEVAHACESASGFIQNGE